MEQQVKNNFGINIKVCCASCQFKEYKDDKERICKLSKLATHPSEYCTSWKMEEGLMNIGKGGGRVKRKKWFEYVKEHGYSDKSVLEFEKEFGSRYMDGRKR